MSYKVLIVEDLPELIEAMSDFYRGTSGSGLGLAIAENNLAMLGYKLDVDCDEGGFVATVIL